MLETDDVSWSEILEIRKFLSLPDETLELFYIKFVHVRIPFCGVLQVSDSPIESSVYNYIVYVCPGKRLTNVSFLLNLVDLQ